ncbi:DUF1569 domain-containing protein [Niabella ginsengisoli]|uniref:DUF1569 domain-containing protein n=1 Tax=Niabella ginsengisoli TaxID=522298 RepID=A0ABS9SEB5_9BACT|nr:DUF1569 domain-containing protein [Niabella ginsengisoli]MCH5596700.1 DUF1569 domain-containing protein [Niabella ginsengisoli]
MTDLFSAEGVAAFIERINKLTPETKPLWGKMNVDQMLAHVNVPYEMVYDTGKHSKPKGLMKWILRKFVKTNVVNDTPYKRNMRTAPAFIIADRKDFEAEKERLLDNLQRTQQLGSKHFDGKESHSFGPLTITEWNNMFSKHLDHHLIQFGV